MNRRNLVMAAAVFAMSATLGGVVHAQQDYPNRAVRVVVPWPVGGVTDIGARIVGERLSQNLGRPVVVENKPGASGRSAPITSAVRHRTATPCSISPAPAT